MRRSVMIQHLSEIYFKHMREPHATDDAMYDAILGDIEKLGIKPPTLADANLCLKIGE